MGIGNYNINLIADRALEHKFGERANQLGLQRARVVVAIYESVFTPEQRRAIKSLKGWTQQLDNGTTLYLRCGDRDYRLECVRFGKSADLAAEGAVLKGALLPNHDFKHRRHDVPAEVCDQVNAFATALAQFERDYINTREEMRAFLLAAPNLKALARDWPEGEPFYRDLLPAKRINLPAVRIEAINKLFELPIDEQAKLKADASAEPTPPANAPLTPSLAAAVEQR
jgi:hypothetical protein